VSIYVVLVVLVSDTALMSLYSGMVEDLKTLLAISTEAFRKPSSR